jgi:beta-phosphoglucomutase-like phosphatase (HAD superfamily)
VTGRILDTKMHHPSLVIFDCDGVLVDSERLSHSVLKDMIGELGVALTLDETLEHFMGTSPRSA